MKKDTVKLILVFFIFFLLDLIKPFGYSFFSEFLFLGIIFVALNYDLGTSLLFAIVFGYFKDSFAPYAVPFSIVGFVFLCIFIHILRRNIVFAVKGRFRKYIKVVIASIAIIVYLTFNFLGARVISPFLFAQFFIQSLLILFLTEYLLKKWLTIRPPEGF